MIPPNFLRCEDGPHCGQMASEYGPWIAGRRITVWGRDGRPVAYRVVQDGDLWTLRWEDGEEWKRRAAAERPVPLWQRIWRRIRG